MTMFPENDAPGPRKPPVTYSKRSGLADCMRAASTLSDDGDNEARGAQAFDRVSSQNRSARDYGWLARRATNVINGSRNRNPSKPLRRPGTLVKPSIRSTDTMRRTEPSRSKRGLTSNTQEEDDIAEAMARSLDDALSSPLAPETEERHDLDLSKAKLKFMLNSDSPPKLPRERHSYKDIGGGSASTSASPHDAFHSILNGMDIIARVLGEGHNEGAEVTRKEVANCIRQWQGTMGKVVYAHQAAEHRRIKEVQEQLDFDRDVEAAQTEKINGLNRAWAAVMKKKEQEWQKKMQEQKRKYEARFTAENTATTEREQVGGGIALSERSVDRSGKSETLKSEGADIMTKMKATHASEINFWKRKVERLAEENAHFRQAKIDTNGEQSNRQHGHSEPPPSLRNATSPGKRKLDEEASKSEGADWSPKRPKTGRTL